MHNISEIMDIENLKIEFRDREGNFDILGKNLVESLKILLDKNKIKFLSINYRVKELNSFIEKIERKSYDSPFEDMEDLCGIRIICYYQKDILEIERIIKKEFNTFEISNKEDNLDPSQFGYRSHHYIASIKKEWENTPNFRDLSTLKFELQVRTILMHAWAEIEHSLAYKNEVQTPKQFRRKLFRISAKLEEADEQFEELKHESELYQKSLHKVSKDIIEISEKELNIDTLQAYMDSNFPRRKKDLEATGQFLNQLVEYNISLKDLSNSWEKIKPKFKEMEQEYLANNPVFSKWAQVGIARFVLDLTIPKYRKRIKRPGHDKKMSELFDKYFA